MSVQSLNERFLAARRNDPILKEREVALQRLDLAIDKQREIAINLSEALSFYQEFAGLLDQLRSTVKEVSVMIAVPDLSQITVLICQFNRVNEQWVMARRQEAQNMLNTMQMEDLSLRQSQQSPTQGHLQSERGRATVSEDIDEVDRLLQAADEEEEDLAPINAQSARQQPKSPATPSAGTPRRAPQQPQEQQRGSHPTPRTIRAQQPGQWKVGDPIKFG